MDQRNASFADLSPEAKIVMTELYDQFVSNPMFDLIPRKMLNLPPDVDLHALEDDETPEIEKYWEIKTKLIHDALATLIVINSGDLSKPIQLWETP
jgi:hypothetical protein